MPIEFKVGVIKSKAGVTGVKVSLDGYVDASTLNEFEQVMGKLIEKDVKNVVVDCTKLEYINSAGVGLLLKYTDEFKEIEGRFALTHIPQGTMAVIQMLGFDRELNIYPDEAAALKDAAKPAKI
ncbi:MAG: STAS domain-containing protein [Planctomycetes bacterium]|nr:STAS domain-containing protein [Planctomycetota bacterium]